MVETEGSARCALLVDAIHDQRQVVIKSLEANYRQVPGIAAATILGDGRVALILDIDTFVARTIAARRPRTPSRRSRLMPMTRNQRRQPPTRPRIHRLPHRRAGILHRHHVGARNSRLDAGDGAAARAGLSCAASSICAASVLPIVDLAERLGFPPTDASARQVIIVAQIGAQIVGLLVDAVSDILTLTTENDPADAGRRLATASSRSSAACWRSTAA